MIQCSYCGRENEVTQVYCLECGTIMPGKVVVPVLTEKERVRAEARAVDDLRKEQVRRARKQEEFRCLTKGEVFRRCLCSGVMAVWKVQYSRSYLIFPSMAYYYTCLRCGREVRILSKGTLAGHLTWGGVSTVFVVLGLLGLFDSSIRATQDGLMVPIAGAFSVSLLGYAWYEWQEKKAHPLVPPEELGPNDPKGPVGTHVEVH